MTLYNPIKDTDPTPPTLVNDATDYIFGLSFKVTENCTINGVWWYVAPSQLTTPSPGENIALWDWTGSAWAYVAGSETAAGTYSTGWNLLSFGSPISISASTGYLAVKSVSGAGNNAYSAVSEFFVTGPGTNGFTDGPVTVYSASIPSGAASNKEPFGQGQQVFWASGTDVTDVSGANGNLGTFNGGWYGMDIQVSASAASSGAGLLMLAFP
jgi:Domain of unknown function (DUF4082)